MKRLLITMLLEVCVILVLHTVFLWVLAEKNIVAVIFSAGPNTPLSALALAGGFILIRLMAVLVLPGIVLSRLGMAAIEFLRLRRAARTAKASEVPLQT